MTQQDIDGVIDRFGAAFNRNDLDEVMTFFAAGAVYQPVDGTPHRGPAAIRAAFEPQFRYAFGAMRFDEHDRVVDVAARKAVVRWACRHDLSGARFYRFLFWAQRIGAGILFGKRFGWQGLDIFHFDESGKIIGKFTYANCPWPGMQKSLGVPLP